MERSPKKPRLHGPDGFQKPTSTSRYKPPESITKFVSAFNDDGKPVAHVKTVSPPSNPFLSSEAGPSKPRQQSKPSSVHRLYAVKADEPLPPLKVLKPPILVPPTEPPPAASSSKTKTTPSSLQPVLKRPPTPLENPRSILKPPIVPLPLSTKPSAPLKPLAPPPQLPSHRPTSPTKPMKTILTTRIAQATDPTKEGSGPELLSLFLKQHGHGFVSETEREMQRGVMVSPDKRSRGKDPKFLRGGLAERFHHRISCAKTDFVLWKRQLEQKIDAGTRFGSDMQLRILRVLDVGKVPERARFTPSPRSGLALCRLTRRHPLMSGDLTLGTYVVVFHFATTSGNAGRSPVSSIDQFEQGNEVMVWLPWQRVELVGVERGARFLEMVRALDALTPPRSLLVVSRFFIVAPRLLVDAT